jgi:hypothetical protein
MTIVYVSICRARDAAILCEVTDPQVKGTNVSQVAIQLLEHLRDHPTLMEEGERKTFVHHNAPEVDFLSHFVEACATAMGEEEELDEYYFHLFLKDQVYYVCLGDDADVRDQKV